jgi:hypothetical protein|tara:strand:+ start:2996 stop:3457 length:462 start_codon:yes stop_codon:yes gene_type:complete
MIQKLTSIGALIGVICTIGGGFYAWGEFNTRLAAMENKKFVINETVDLSGITEKVTDLEVNILDRMSALEDEWMIRDNDSTDGIVEDIIRAKQLSAAGDVKLSKEIKEIFKEFGKIRDLINDLGKKLLISQKQSELNKILIDEMKAEASSPLG